MSAGSGATVLTAGKQTFGERLTGVIRLESWVFRDIARDPHAMWQALLVVALAALANGLGHIGGGFGGFIGGIVAALVGWGVFCVAAWLIGQRLAPWSAPPPSRLVRLVGFAQAPKLIAALGFLPLVGWFFGAAAALLALIVAIVALRIAFEIDFIRAIAIGVAAIVVSEIVLFVLQTIFGLGGVVIGALAFIGRPF
ncbi:MAG TPA: YIP1 family protein [Thermomicrobiales bacterium]|nr:YIP1 family protein [Thermomicrobiales bacterium]